MSTEASEQTLEPAVSQENQSPLGHESSTGEQEMLPAYDFRTGVRGQYSPRYAAGSNVVVLAPDVAAVFPNSQAVNEALRTLVRLTRAQESHGAVGAA